MVADSKEPELTDDEWREEKFSQEQLISARLMGNPPSFEALKNYIERFGPDGVLETAIMLPRAQYEQLEKLCKKAPTQRTPRRRRRH